MGIDVKVSLILSLLSELASGFSKWSELACPVAHQSPFQSVLVDGCLDSKPSLVPILPYPPEDI